jgi:hypothetical protein
MSRFIKISGNRIGLDEVETICGAAGFSTIATGDIYRETFGPRGDNEAVLSPSWAGIP